MTVKKSKCEQAIFNFSVIDAFSKNIELTYEGRVKNATLCGASMTVALLIMMMFVGL